MAAASVTRTDIPGLLVVPLTVHGDARGWFKENWQRERMVASGLPDFGPVQHSVAYNGHAGVTRGLHAEPWDKFVSVAHGRIFGAWVDLREGPTFGVLHTQELDEATAVFVPRGVANAYQTLVDGTVYSYLVNAHWSPDASYTHVNLADPGLGVPWPIELSAAEVSEKDRAHPLLAEVVPVARPSTVLLGSSGQLGRAVGAIRPDARMVGPDQVDLADGASIDDLDLGGAEVVINAAAMTAVDRAETPEGRQEAWAVNAAAVARLARRAVEERFVLVHFSTDYVFDGQAQLADEGTPLSPLSVYGQSKAAGDLAVCVVPRHYLLRTSWVIGDGANFVRTMRRLARSGASPQVVADQVGRLTFADELARAADHLLQVAAPFGTYDVTAGGPAMSWAEIARAVFSHEDRDPGDVHDVTTTEYSANSDGPIAPRPGRSVLDLTRVQSTGFDCRDQRELLTAYLDQLDNS